VKFYNRKKELALFEKIRKRSVNTAQMTVMVGRRRMGKTRLLCKALDNNEYLYFFVAKKDEKLLCEEYVEIVKDRFKVPVFGKISRFSELFAFLVELSKTKSFTLAIDEFQEFNSINPAVFSEMQNIWDTNKVQSKLNLVLTGSIYSLMKRIFENAKEPLFGRTDERIHLKPFDITTLKEIISDNFPNYKPIDLLAFYTLTGGVAKYVELFVDKEIFEYEAMLQEMFRENSYWLDEGKNLLVEEFGKEYTTYFSILALISSSKTSRVEIESILEINVGGYLNRLENEYGILRKIRPVFAKQGSRTVKYFINDNFLNFWFRFIYKNRTAVEIGNFDYLLEIVRRDFNTFSGRFLEKYFVQKLANNREFSQIGSYWEKGNKNEIDIVAINKIKQYAVIVEVKLNKDKINIEKLKQKSQKLILQLKNYYIEYKGFSLDDM
jgi:hypothetical protein